MNQQVEKTLKCSKEHTVKSCLKVTKTAEKRTSETSSIKYRAHSGIPFKSNMRKETTMKPFSFDKPQKSEKETKSHLNEKSVESQVDTEKIDFTDASGQVKVVMDTLKISKSSENACTEKSLPSEKTPKRSSHSYAREKSPCSRCTRSSHSLQSLTKETKEKSTDKTSSKERPLKTPSVDCARDKKPCSRCSRTASSPQPPKAGKDEVKKSKVASSQEQPLKTAKSQIQQCSKLYSPTVSSMAKVHEAKLQGKTSNAVKPKSTSNKAGNIEADSSNICTSGKLECEPSSLPLLDSNGKISKMCSLKAETAEGVASSSESTESDSSDTDKIVIVNGTSPVSEASIAEEPECKLLNGTNAELDDTNGITNESSASKLVSKIPRKTFGSPVVKIEVNPQPLSVEN